jgi:hypothetical protein
MYSTYNKWYGRAFCANLWLWSEGLLNLSGNILVNLLMRFEGVKVWNGCSGQKSICKIIGKNTGTMGQHVPFSKPIAKKRTQFPSICSTVTLPSSKPKITYRQTVNPCHNLLPETLSMSVHCLKKKTPSETVESISRQSAYIPNKPF